jgi:hypothetical protein
MDHIIREANKNEFDPNNIKKEDGFSLRKLWKPLICFLKDCIKPLPRDSLVGFSAEAH